MRFEVPFTLNDIFDIPAGDFGSIRFLVMVFAMEMAMSCNGSLLKRSMIPWRSQCLYFSISSCLYRSASTHKISTKLLFVLTLLVLFISHTNSHCGVEAVNVRMCLSVCVCVSVPMWRHAMTLLPVNNLHYRCLQTNIRDWAQFEQLTAT